jgi:hypothetical protein
MRGRVRKSGGRVAVTLACPLTLLLLSQLLRNFLDCARCFKDMGFDRNSPSMRLKDCAFVLAGIPQTGCAALQGTRRDDAPSAQHFYARLSLPRVYKDIHERNITKDNHTEHRNGHAHTFSGALRSSFLLPEAQDAPAQRLM